MIEVGQLVTRRPDSTRYNVTTDKSLCLVEVVNDYEILVKVVAHANGKYYRGWVETEYFIPCTYAQFMEKYPDAALTSSYSAEELNKINNGESKEETKMELVMNKEKIGSYELTVEERESLRKEIKDLLEEYNYNPTDVGVNAILDEWIKNKGWMINLFKKHPNYNGKFQIAFDSDYNRVCDKNILSSFQNYFVKTAKKLLLKEKILGGFSYEETYVIYNRLQAIVDRLYALRYDYKYYVPDYKEKEKELERWEKKYKAYRRGFTNGTLYHEGYIVYDGESYKEYQKVYNFGETLYYMREHIADETFANKVNEYFPKVKAVAGQKVSRIVGKIAKQLGIDKDPDWNREYAKYSDAINPLAVKRHTVLSCHPIDYFTMSFGNSWASYHTIDKTNKRGMPNDYEGCYSSGTLSYMLDGSSFVYYTVDKDYNGNELELQDKINRNMFHMGEDKLIQARVYPQATDGETGIYKQIREIAQKVIADCLGVPNMWKNVKGVDECYSVTDSYGTHYKDYTNFSDCNVSYLKDETEAINKNRIDIGHNPICPHCGKAHTYEKAIECRECYASEIQCDNCGYTYSRQSMHEIDGEWYCEDCCFYCEYHERWEVGDPGDQIRIDNYGRICEDALDDSEIFYTCNRCGRIGLVDRDDYIETEDSRHYCDYRCAERDGYRETSDGEWYPEGEVYYCEHCERDVHASEWNSELDCCTDCVEEVKAERAEEAEEREAV